MNCIENVAYTLKNMHYELYDKEHRPGMFVKVTEEVVFCVIISNGEKMNLEKYKSINQMSYLILSQNFKRNIQILNIMITDDGFLDEKKKNILDNINNIWFVSNDINKIYIYENQPVDFDGLYRKLEENLTKYNPKNNMRLKIKEKQKLPIATVIIIAICVLHFVITFFWGDYNTSEGLMKMGAMNSQSIINEKEYFRLITCLFMHFSLSHLVGNMLILSYLGYKLENITGIIKFLIIYLGAGIIGNIFSVMFDCVTMNNYVSAGASGAIFGVVGAFIFIAIVNKGNVNGVRLESLIRMTIITIAFGLLSTGIDNMAHIGGLLSGFFIEMILFLAKKSYEKK